ncbi:MAG: response regulator [Campylobacterales bacterium]|nr:response regulator [Campylobacterales bacterium]
MFEPLKTKTILLVEDEPIIRENLAATLRYFFKTVYTAQDGFEGLDAFEAHLPDIVCTDLKMPNMGGFELIQTLKARHAKAYTIIVSAHTDTELLLQAIREGVDRYLIKPIGEAELFEAFEAYIETLHVGQKIALDPTHLFDPQELVIDAEAQRYELNKKEALLLSLLLEHRGHSVSYEVIEQRVWGSQSMSFAALRSVVRDLRKKIGSAQIHNLSALGYRLE